MTDTLIYHEKISSNKTESLFLALTTLFFVLLIWRMATAGLDILAGIFLCFFGVFLFYALNYKTLHIRLMSKSLKLAFGIFTWTIPLDNIEECRLDEIPMLAKYGGAGIHLGLSLEPAAC